MKTWSTWAWAGALLALLLLLVLPAPVRAETAVVGVVYTSTQCPNNLMLCTHKDADIDTGDDIREKHPGCCCPKGPSIEGGEPTKLQYDAKNDRCAKPEEMAGVSTPQGVECAKKYPSSDWCGPADRALLQYSMSAFNPDDLNKFYFGTVTLGSTSSYYCCCRGGDESKKQLPQKRSEGEGSKLGNCAAYCSEYKDSVPVIMTKVGFGKYGKKNNIINPPTQDETTPDYIPKKDPRDPQKDLEKTNYIFCECPNGIKEEVANGKKVKLCEKTQKKLVEVKNVPVSCYSADQVAKATALMINAIHDARGEVGICENAEEKGKICYVEARLLHKVIKDNVNDVFSEDINLDDVSENHLICIMKDQKVIVMSETDGKCVAGGIVTAAGELVGAGIIISKLGALGGKKNILDWASQEREIRQLRKKMTETLTNLGEADKYLKGMKSYASGFKGYTFENWLKDYLDGASKLTKQTDLDTLVTTPSTGATRGAPETKFLKDYGLDKLDEAKKFKSFLEAGEHIDASSGKIILEATRYDNAIKHTDEVVRALESEIKPLLEKGDFLKLTSKWDDFVKMTLSKSKTIAKNVDDILKDMVRLVDEMKLAKRAGKAALKGAGKVLKGTGRFLGRVLTVAGWAWLAADGVVTTINLVTGWSELSKATHIKGFGTGRREDSKVCNIKTKEPKGEIYTVWDNNVPTNPIRMLEIYYAPDEGVELPFVKKEWMLSGLIGTNSPSATIDIRASVPAGGCTCKENDLDQYTCDCMVQNLDLLEFKTTSLTSTTKTETGASLMSGSS